LYADILAVENNFFHELFADITLQTYCHTTHILCENFILFRYRVIINKSFIKKKHRIRLLKIIYRNQVVPSFTAWEVKLTHPGGFVTLTTCVWLLYYRYGNAFIPMQNGHTSKTVQLFLNCTCHAMWSF